MENIILNVYFYSNILIRFKFDDNVELKLII
jgi:hypothetical protein